MPIIIKVGKKEYRIEASNELKTIIVKKGSKDKIEFDQEKFYFKTRKSDI